MTKVSNRAMAGNTRITPLSIAKIIASDTYNFDPGSAIPLMALAIIRDTITTGPIARVILLPYNPYSNRGNMVTYSLM